MTTCVFELPSALLRKKRGLKRQRKRERKKGQDRGAAVGCVACKSHQATTAAVGAMASKALSLIDNLSFLINTTTSMVLPLTTAEPCITFTFPPSQ